MWTWSIWVFNNNDKVYLIIKAPLYISTVVGSSGYINVWTVYIQEGSHTI